MGYFYFVKNYSLWFSPTRKTKAHNSTKTKWGFERRSNLVQVNLLFGIQAPNLSCGVKFMHVYTWAVLTLYGPI